MIPVLGHVIGLFLGIMALLMSLPACVAYGAQIVAETTSEYGGGVSTQSPDLAYISNSNALVGVMMSVNPDRTPGDGRLRVTEGQSAANTRDLVKSLDEFEYKKPDFVYRYYADGLVAERVDRRGVSLRYFYDEHRRLREQEVWHYDLATGTQENPLTTGQLTIRRTHTVPTEVGEDPRTWAAAGRGYPKSMDIPSASAHAGAPTDRVGFIKYEYDAGGNLERVTARKGRHESAIITDTKYVYDERGNLTREYQAHGVAAESSGVPFMTYARTYTAGTSSSTTIGTTGRDRLTGMTYPAFSGIGFTASRAVTFGYGTANMADDVSERIASISMGTAHVASFGYTGAGRRVGLRMGGTSSAPKLTQTFDTNGSGVGIEGLDRFGRMLDLHYRNTASSDSTLWHGEYGYDLAGNRTHEKLTQRPHTASGAGENTRSRLFAFDALDRLLGVKSGELSTAPYSVGASDAYPSVRKEAWNPLWPRFSDDCATTPAERRRPAGP